MGADSSDEDDWVFGVAERATSCEVVGRAASRCCDADTVSLDGGEMLIVAENLNGGHGSEVVSICWLM